MILFQSQIIILIIMEKIMNIDVEFLNYITGEGVLFM